MMLAQGSYGSCPISEIPKAAPMGHSTFPQLDYSRDQHIYSELLGDNNIDVQHTLGVRPIHNQFWQYPFCNVNRLWQPDKLHQLLIALVKELLHWLLKYLNARNVKNQCDNRFTSVPRYPCLQHFSQSFDSLNSATWQGNEIPGMIRTLAVNCTPILNYPKDDGNIEAGNSSDEIVMGVLRTLYELSLLVTNKITRVYPSKH